MTVVLLPEPALGGHVRRAHQLEHRVGIVGGGVHVGGREARRRRGGDPRAVIQRGVVEQRSQRHVADDLALVLQHHVASVGGDPDGGGVQAPLLEDTLTVSLAAGLQDRQHPLLALRQHHLVGAHAVFALRHHVEVKLDADAALAGHLDRRGGEASGAHVLDGGHRARSHQLQGRFDQQLFGEGVPDLDGRALLVGGVHDVDGHVLGVCLAGGEGAALAVADDDVSVLVGVGEDGHDHAVELDRVDECPVEVDL